MNKKIADLMRSRGLHTNISQDCQHRIEILSGLIIEECCLALRPMLRDMISRGEAVDLIKKHFGVEE